MTHFAIANLNADLFTEQLNAVLGYTPPFITRRGSETDATTVILFPDGALRPGDENTVQDVIDAHDYTALTDAQAAERDAQSRREAALEVLALTDTDTLLARVAAANTLEALRSAALDVASLVRALVTLKEG